MGVKPSSFYQVRNATGMARPSKTWQRMFIVCASMSFVRWIFLAWRTEWGVSRNQSYTIDITSRHGAELPASAFRTMPGPAARAPVLVAESGHEAAPCARVMVVRRY